MPMPSPAESVRPARPIAMIQPGAVPALRRLRVVPGPTAPRPAAVLVAAPLVARVEVALLRHLAVPVEASAPKRRILVATDFSTAASAAWELALRLARRTEATIDLLHVASGGAGRAAERAQAVAVRLGACVEAAREAGVPCSATSLEGEPAPVVLRQAQRTRPALLVFGVPDGGPGPCGRTWNPNTAQSILASPRRDVVAVGVVG